MSTCLPPHSNSYANHIFPRTTTPHYPPLPLQVADAVGDTLASLVDGSALEDISEFLETGNLLSDGATYGERTYGALHAALHSSGANEGGVPGAVDIEYSRGRFYEYIYDVFVAVGPSHARQHRFKDHFEGLHYALLDVAVVEGARGGSSSDSGSRWEMTVTTMDQENRAVIQRRVPLEPLHAYPRAPHASVADLQQRWDNAGGVLLPERTCMFQPYHGHTPLWRLRMIKWSLFLLPICSIAVPFIMAVCLVWLFVRSALHSLWRRIINYRCGGVREDTEAEEEDDDDDEVEVEVAEIEKLFVKKTRAKGASKGREAKKAVPPSVPLDSSFAADANTVAEAEAVGAAKGAATRKRSSRSRSRSRR